MSVSPVFWGSCNGVAHTKCAIPQGIKKQAHLGLVFGTPIGIVVNKVNVIVKRAGLLA